MQDYVPSDATERAREVRERFPGRRVAEDTEMARPEARRLRASSLDLRRGKRETARGRGLHTIELGRERVDLSYLEQLAEDGQTEAIARMVGDLASGGDRSLAEFVRQALEGVEGDLGSLGSFRGHPGAMSLPRAQELAAAINRVRSLSARPDAR